MSYDWSQGSGPERGTLHWFDHQDRRSTAEHAHFLEGHAPHELLAGDAVREADVLEIGVGAGFHAELLARAGAHVHGIDLSQVSVALTQRRFELKGLEGTFETWDAELARQDFEGRFDLVWSWGVVHHSAHTARIVRNVHRWLKPDGAFAGMVYHRDSLRLPVAILRDWITSRGFEHSVDEALVRNTDGFSARFYPADQWRDLLLAFFDSAETSVEGLDVDLIPLPRRLRRMVWERLDPEARRRRLQRVGHFLLFRASRPRDASASVGRRTE
jgi:SAM-dependent methyltransferase